MRRGYIFSVFRIILLYSLLLVLLDVTLENCLLSLFARRGSNDREVNFDASKCVTLVCNHTNIASIWNWNRVVTEIDNCLFSWKLGWKFVQSRVSEPVVKVSSSVFSVKTYILQCSHSVWLQIMKGVAKGFPELSRQFYMISALVSLCCNEGGESPLPSQGSGACCRDILYCQKVWWRWFIVVWLP